MTKRITQMASVAALSLVATATSFADVKLNDNISLSGYVVGLADSKSIDKTENVSGLDIQATKLATKVNFAPVSGTVSLFAGSDNKVAVLDAYATYDLGGGTSVTGGKFLSWLGYEAFDPVNMINITYAWSTDALGAFPGIPGYHTGVKVEYSTDTMGAGLAVVDSNDSNFFTDVKKGDGDLDNGAGLEGYYTYKGKALTVFLGAAYNSAETEPGSTYYVSPADTGFKSYSGDIWVQYVVGQLTIAGEYSLYKAKFDPIPGTPPIQVKDLKTYFAGVWVKYAVSDKFALVGRVSTGKTNLYGAADKPTYVKYTFSPVLTVTGNLEICGEASYTTYDKIDPIDSSTYFGVQARFKF
ncbi:MAG: outer membrane beta-barrel protein [Nibricoccus sp.]